MFVCVCVIHLQRDKQRVLAESVHEAKSRVSQQKDRWRVQYYTNEGKLIHFPKIFCEAARATVVYLSYHPYG